MYAREHGELRRREARERDPRRLHAAKLRELAERAHVQEGTLARSLLSWALDDADPDARHIAAVIDGIPGAWEGIREGEDQAARGEGITLDELAAGGGGSAG